MGYSVPFTTLQVSTVSIRDLKVSLLRQN